jgi:bile acid:Na+ symporter, BASS family
VLVFNFFGGLGGMAIVAAWWGIWHIIVGTSLAAWWRRHPPTPLRAGAAA